MTDPSQPAVRRAHARQLLGLLARDCGHNEAAARLLAESATALPEGDPAAAEFHNNASAVLSELGRWGEALEHAERAVACNADFAPAQHNLSLALENNGRVVEAVEAAKRAVTLHPEYAAGLLHQGQLLRKHGRLEDAEMALREAVRLTPDDYRPVRELGHVLAEQLRLDAVVSVRRQVVELAPNWPGGGSELLFTLHYHPQYGARQHYEDARAWAVRHADPFATDVLHFENIREPDRRLRIGYVSSDLRDHPVGRLIEPAITLRDRERFEVFCYSEVAKPDRVSRHIRSVSDAWRDTAGLSDDDVAARIREDQIDILVDCTGHFGDHRLGVFARKPAPVQVSAFGYCGTTGVSTIDYRLTDALSDPPGAEQWYSEKLWRLPRVCWVYRPFDGAPDVGPLPADENGYITFGCLNNLIIVTDEVVAVWAKVLLATPRSRFILLGTTLHQHIADKFASCGIDPDRIEIAGRRPRVKYFELHNRIDICVDPFPFNGDNTICDGLWMGVPSVAMIGDRFAARRGLSHLSAVGLAHLAAGSGDEYVAIASRLTCDLPALSALRQGMRARLQNSALGDAPGYVKDLENGLPVDVERVVRRFPKINVEGLETF